MPTFMNIEQRLPRVRIHRERRQGSIRKVVPGYAEPIHAGERRPPQERAYSKGTAGTKPVQGKIAIGSKGKTNPCFKWHYADNRPE